MSLQASLNKQALELVPRSFEYSKGSDRTGHHNKVILDCIMKEFKSLDDMSAHERAELDDSILLYLKFLDKQQEHIKWTHCTFTVD
jgi:hypothetical protein